MTRSLKRKGKVWIRVFPQASYQAAETRMGKGKGSVEKWVAVIRPGTMLFEVAGCSATAAREALRLADTKLPFRCRFVSRDEL